MKLKQAKKWSCAKCGGHMQRVAGLWECKSCGFHPRPADEFKNDIPRESGMKRKMIDDE